MGLDVSEGVKEKVIKDGYDPKFGARPLRRAVQQLLENPLSNEIIGGKFKEGDIVITDMKDGKITFEKGASQVEKPKPEQPKDVTAMPKPLPAVDSDKSAGREKKRTKK
jgi:hypothetical protein